eukprot:6375368-Amphidinium_carterae.1
MRGSVAGDAPQHLRAALHGVASTRVLQDVRKHARCSIDLFIEVPFRLWLNQHPKNLSLKAPSQSSAIHKFHTCTYAQFGLALLFDSAFAQVV